jgi:hypothetical protein
MIKPLNVDSLRRDAHSLKKSKGIQHTRALDIVAREYGFEKWTDLIAAQNTEDRAEKRGVRSPYRLRRGGLGQSLEEQPPEGAHASPYENPAYVKQIFRP